MTEFVLFGCTTVGALLGLAASGVWLALHLVFGIGAPLLNQVIGLTLLSAISLPVLMTALLLVGTVINTGEGAVIDD